MMTMKMMSLKEKLSLDKIPYMIRSYLMKMATMKLEYLKCLMAVTGSMEVESK